MYNRGQVGVYSPVISYDTSPQSFKIVVQRYNNYPIVPNNLRDFFKSN